MRHQKGDTNTCSLCKRDDCQFYLLPKDTKFDPVEAYESKKKKEKKTKKKKKRRELTSQEDHLWLGERVFKQLCVIYIGSEAE